MCLGVFFLSTVLPSPSLSLELVIYYLSALVGVFHQQDLRQQIAQLNKLQNGHLRHQVLGIHLICF